MKHSLCLSGLVAALPLLITLPTNASWDDLQIGGYGSIVAGQTLNSGQLYTSDWHDVGQYENELSFKPDSMLALQARGNLTEKLSFTAQLVAKGADDFSPEFDWYYLTYEATDSLSIMAGRRTIPMYYFSEYHEVGFAYPWVRPPSNLYWWQINFFDGIHASYDFAIGGLDHSVSVFYGNENDDDNKELRTLYSRGFSRVSEEWKDITGFNWIINGDFYDIRIVHFQLDRDRVYYNSASVPTEIPTDSSNSAIFRLGTYEFYGIGGSVQLQSFTFYYDYNLVKTADYVDNNVATDNVTDYPTFLLTLVYNIGDIQPYISYSKADQTNTSSTDPVTGIVRPRAQGQADDDYEQHVLTSIGVRYNLSNSSSLKVQYDNFDDQGFEPQGWDFHGDSKTISVGIDFIF